MCLGIPGRILEVVDTAGTRARVDIDGVDREVSLAMLALDGGEVARAGDWVLVHLGLAMARIDEAEARETLVAMRELADMYEQGLAGGSAVLQRGGDLLQ